MDFAKGIVCGKVYEAPILRQVQEGKKAAFFSVITTIQFTDPSGKSMKRPQRHNIVAPNGLSEETMKTIKKDDEVYVEGRLCYRTFTARDGKATPITEIIANEIQKSGARISTQATQGNNTLPGPSSGSQNQKQQKLPFQELSSAHGN